MSGDKSKSVRLFGDLLQDDSESGTKISFQLITDTALPFGYEVAKDGLLIADSYNSGVLELLDAQNMIKIMERDIPYKKNLFRGSPEPILSGGLKFVQPCKGRRGFDGEDLSIELFGNWKCQRCGHIMNLPLSNGHITEPFECQNEDCGRKSQFIAQFPKELIKPIWKLPSIPVSSTSYEIYSDLYKFCKRFLVLKESEYHILTLWIMASYLVDDFQTCPYLCVIAPKSSGKTQVLNVISELAYRSVAAISVTAASLFRAIEQWHITLLIDEAEYQVKQDSESGQALYGCLNGGYKRGSYAMRTEGDSSNRLPATYEVFGFKAIASTKLFNPTLESRSIIFNMAQGMPKEILIDSKTAIMIRSKLLYWRFETLGKLPIIYPDSNSGRLKEMFMPLFTVAQTLKDTGIKSTISHADLINLLKSKIADMENQRKEEEKGSQDAQIIQAISKIKTDGSNTLSDERGAISVKEITEYLKDILGWEDKPGREKVGNAVGRKLKVLGINTHHTMHGSVIELDPTTVSTINELEKRFL